MVYNHDLENDSGYNDESSNEYSEYYLSMIETYDDLNRVDDNHYINFYNYMKMYNCPFYKLLNRDDNQFNSYVVIKTSFNDLF